MNCLRTTLTTTVLFGLSLMLPVMKRDTASKITRAHVIRTHTVDIKQMAFSPDKIVVQKGDRITFVNHDMVTHDITEAIKVWSSPPIPAGKSWSMTIIQSAAYYCSMHPVMKGEIIVK